MQYSGSELEPHDRPLADHYASLRGFSTITSLDQKGKFVDLISVVVNFTEIKSTRGSDMQRSLIVCDPTAALVTSGLLVQFYRPTAKELPRPAEGSIIVLKSFKLFDYRGVFQAWSHHSSEWIIYDANGRNILSKSDKFVHDPDEAVQAYITRLANWWKARSGQSAITNIPVPQNLNSASAHSIGRETIAIKDAREHKFFDVYGYVVKTFPSRDNAFTIYITDYTKNGQLHDYVYGESKWSGPFGQLTMQVTLWDAHARYARAHIHDDQYVFLRNVQGKRSDSGRLEGALRGDRQAPDKINVMPIPATEPVLKAIKLRRAQYENTWKLEKERIEDEIMQAHREQNILQLTPPTSINPNLETSYKQVPLTPVGDILDPPYVPQTERNEGPGARKRARKYRTVGRIIDFWPSDLRDFSRPYCMSCQATYIPKASGARVAYPACTLCNVPRDTEDPDTYEIAFTILLEGQDNVCMPIIYSGEDVETLLGAQVVPCNLHLPQNRAALARLREQLFLFWGDLEEKLSANPRKKPRLHHLDVSDNTDDDPLMWNELCVMEYWVNEVGGQAGWGGRRFRGFGSRIL